MDNKLASSSWAPAGFPGPRTDDLI